MNRHARETTCPAPQDVWRARDGVLPREQRRAILGHVARCDVCDVRLRAEEIAGPERIGELAAGLQQWALTDGYVEFRRRLLQQPRHVRQAAFHARRPWLPIAALIPVFLAGAVLARTVEPIRHLFTLATGTAASPKTPQDAPMRPPAPAQAQHAVVVPVRAPAPDRNALVEAELDVRLVLRRTALDVRGINVALTRETVRVAGVVSASEDRTVRKRLTGLPHVQIALRVAQSAAPVSTPQPPLSSSGPTSTGTTAAPEIGTPNSPTYLADLGLSVRRTREHLAAVSGLAQRFPPGDVRVLPPPARAKLDQLLDLHYRSLRGELDDLDARLATRSRRQARRILPPLRMPGDWRRRVADALTVAQTLDRLVASLADTAGGGERHPRYADEMHAAFDALWNIVSASPR